MNINRIGFHEDHEDGDEDLLVVSDYAGIDIYRNDGRGVFADVTGDLIDERRLFGMAHTFADFDAFHGVDGHHGRREIGVELAIDRRAQTGREA